MTESRVLLLEDNPDDADIILHSIRESGEKVDVVHVERLAKAIEELGRGAFDVMIVDLHVPDSSGLETFLRLHQRFPTLPIVVVTVSSDQTLATQALRQGAQDYVVKEALDPARLLGTLHYAIERQRLFNDVLGESSKREKMEAMIRKCGTTHLWAAMFRVLGQGAGVVLYNAGTAAGHTSYEFVQGTYTPESDQAFAKALGEHFGLVGLFLVGSMEIDRQGHSVRTRVHRNFELEVPGRDKTRPGCHFLRGLLAGVSSELLDLPSVVCEETACEGTGSPYCEFIAKVKY